jgi:hypothetical protein
MHLPINDLHRLSPMPIHGLIGIEGYIVADVQSCPYLHQKEKRSAFGFNKKNTVVG